MEDHSQENAASVESEVAEKVIRPLQARHLGVFGIVITLIQVYSAGRAERNTRDTVDTAIKAAVSEQIEPMKLYIAGAREEREREFARKVEVKDLGNSISAQLSVLNDEVVKVRVKVSSIDGFLKAQNRNYGKLLPPARPPVFFGFTETTGHSDSGS